MRLDGEEGSRQDIWGIVSGVHTLYTTDEAEVFFVYFTYHFVDDADGFGDGAGLETHCRHALDHFFDCNGCRFVLVEFDAVDFFCVGGDGCGWF